MSTDGAFGRPRLLPSLLGLLLLLMGLALLAGGIKLLSLGGSLYYLVAGAVLVVTGVLLLLGRAAAIGLYALFLLGSTLWAWYEVGLDWWQLVPRLALWFALGIVLLLPWLRRPLLSAGPAPKATALLGLQHPADMDAPLVERLQPLPLAHWLAGGRNAEPILDANSPVDPGIRLHLRLIPYSDHHWLLVARDVTKLLHLEQVRRDFVANVSHELRTPLTVVHGYLDMMDPEDFPDTGPMLAEMRKQSQRMAQLVEDLLTLSRLESQQQTELETVAMTSMLASLRREAEAHSQGRHTITIEDSAGVDLAGSNKELHSTFSNLVTNAVRYTPAGGRITLTFAREGDGAVLAVTDTGYGIPASHLPRLTERFYRVSSSRSRESGGTGLGLSIVKHILGLHQARLDIRSEVGQGSTFACHFDAEHVRPRTALPSPPSTEDSPA